MIEVNSQISLDESEIHYAFMRSPGPGGQNVNKVETAVLLRFNVIDSPSLNSDIKQKLLTRFKNKINKEGFLLIKSNSFRTQERNKQEALRRLIDILKMASVIYKKRKATKPTFASKQKRLEKKRLHSKLKGLRRIRDDE